jgi:hypothetical protein
MYRSSNNSNGEEDAAVKLLNLSSNGSANLTELGGNLSEAFVSGTPTSTAKHGWWRSFDSGAATLARIQLLEPAHETLGISGLTAKSPYLKGMSNFLNEPFCYWLPLGLLRTEEGVDGGGGGGRRLRAEECKVGLQVRVQQGHDAEDTLSDEVDGIVELFEEDRGGDCGGGGGGRSSGSPAPLAATREESGIKEKATEEEERGGPAVSLLLEEPLQRLLWPRVDGRAGPGHGCFGKRAVLLEVSQPRAVVVALDTHHHQTWQQQAAAAAAGRDGAVQERGPSSFLNPFTCFGSGGDDGGGGMCSPLSPSFGEPAGGFCSFVRCDGENNPSGSSGDGVMAYWEGEFNAQWSKRVPPRRHNNSSNNRQTTQRFAGAAVAGAAVAGGVGGSALQQPAGR